MDFPRRGLQRAREVARPATVPNRRQADALGHVLRHRLDREPARRVAHRPAADAIRDHRQQCDALGLER